MNLIFFQQSQQNLLTTLVDVRAMFLLEEKLKKMRGSGKYSSVEMDQMAFTEYVVYYVTHGVDG